MGEIGVTLPLHLDKLVLFVWGNRILNRIAGNIRRVQISFFSFSVYQDENLTHETYVMMVVFSCVKGTTKIKRTNQLEIAPNEIWTRRKFSLYDMIFW